MPSCRTPPASWDDAPAGTVLIEQGAPTDRVLVLAAGRVGVLVAKIAAEPDESPAVLA